MMTRWSLGEDLLDEAKDNSGYKAGCRVFFEGSPSCWVDSERTPRFHWLSWRSGARDQAAISQLLSLAPRIKRLWDEDGNDQESEKIDQARETNHEKISLISHRERRERRGWRGEVIRSILLEGISLALEFGLPLQYHQITQPSEKEGTRDCSGLTHTPL